MISLKNSLSELERCHQSRDIALSCYINAIRSIAQYAVDLDSQAAPPQRMRMEDLASQLASGEARMLTESTATVRAHMREHRDRSTAYLAKLQKELSDATSALEHTLEALSQNDGDHGVQLRKAVTQLRHVPESADTAVRKIVLNAASSIERSLELLDKQRQLTVAQFVMEIRMLHQRIDALESAASTDRLTQLFNREEMELRIRKPQGSKMSLILLKTAGLTSAEVQYGREVAEELAGAFSKRLRNSLPPTSTIGRWSDDGFLAILNAEQSEASALAKRIAEHMAGAYACIKAGKTVRPAIQLTIGIVDAANENVDRTLQKVGAFFNPR